MAETNKNAEEIFKQFKEQSIASFFKKNRQMLGYAGKVRSLTTIVHEYVTNSLDACEEAGILPDIRVEVEQLVDDKYRLKISDNGPGIPKNMIGKALASILSGTKFHRYIQQRGQQGIGASGCTLFSHITTNKPVHVKSSTHRETIECDLSLDIKTNKPVINNLKTLPKESNGLEITADFGTVKYENSDHGVFEYLRRTALANPHASISLKDPTGQETSFPRSVQELPKKAKEIKPHPLGLEATDLVDFAHMTVAKKLSAFLMEGFARVTNGKISELEAMHPEINFGKNPKEMSWEEAETLIKAFKQVKWMAPELDALSTIGQDQIYATIKNILNAEFIAVVERKPKVFRGGVPFVVEVGIAYGGSSGKESNGQRSGNILRFANKVPLLFDSSNCAITQSVKNMDWKRYNIRNFDEEPVSVMVNVSSVYVPYSGVGKQAVSEEAEIVDEIRLAVMDAGRSIQRYLSGVRNKKVQETRYKMIMRYVSQLASDLSELSSGNKQEIEKNLKQIIEHKYKSLFGDKFENASKNNANEETADAQNA